MGTAQPQRSGWTTSSTMLNDMKASHQGKSWTAFTKLYTALFKSWFTRAGVPRADWDDLRSDIFLAVLQGLPSYEHEKGRFRGWLRIIARNKIIDLWRQRKRDFKLLNLDELTQPNNAVGLDLELLYEQALTLLKDEFQTAHWRAFWMTQIEGQSTAAVAEELGMPPAHVYVYRQRVKRRLKDEFGPLLDGKAPDPPKK